MVSNKKSQLLSKELLAYTILHPLQFLSRNKEPGSLIYHLDMYPRRCVSSQKCPQLKYVYQTGMPETSIYEKEETLRGYLITYAMP
jgi:hypothetical protein